MANPPADREKFATYTRDSATGLDYAVNRYYYNVSGRFLSADPRSGGTASNPSSWNRYTYGSSDPINRVDPRGLNDCLASGEGDSSSDGCGDGCPDGFYFDTWSGFCAPTNAPGTCVEGYHFSSVAGDCEPDSAEGNDDNSPPPDCTSTIPADQLNFVQNNYLTSAGLGTLSSIPSEAILGWAALETFWGTNTGAAVNGNFFSWGGKGNISCPPGADPRWGCFSPGFLVSGLTALFSTQNYFHYGSKTGVSSASILTDQFSKGASTTKAFDALAAAGYTPDPGYGAGVSTRTAQVLRIEICLTSLGLIPNIGF